MKIKFPIPILFILISFSSYGQQEIKPDSLVVNAMNKIEWMLGNWSGDGWVDSRDDRKFYNQTESVYTKAKGTVILIEGLGISKENENVAHEAFAVLSYDAFSNKYLLRAFKSDGKYIDAKVNVEDDGTFIWGFKINEMSPELRYTLKLIDNKWFEVGEFSVNGTMWTKFFEMTLKRVKSD